MLRRIGMGLAALAVFAGLLAASVLVTALNAPLMARQFERYGQAPAVTEAAQRQTIAREIVDYLSHRRQDLPAFQMHEQAHMADVRGIFDLLYILAAVGLAGLILLYSLRRQGALKVGCQVFLSLGVMLAVIALWAVIDFDSLFVLFHEVAFTNELWLMDPRRDLMIQLMPTPFFIDYAARIMGLFAGVAASLGLAASLLHRRYAQ